MKSIAALIFFFKITSLCLSQSIMWQKTLGGSGTDQVYSVIPTHDNGTLLSGLSNSDISGDKNENSFGYHDYWVIKLNSAQNIEWQKTIGGDYEDYLISSCATNDNGYVLAGLSSSVVSGNKTSTNYGQGDLWIVKLNSSGEIQWQKTFGGNNNEDIASIIATIDNGLFICGSSSSAVSGNKTDNCYGYHDYWFLKLNSNGEIEWQKSYGGSGEDIATDAEQTSDGGYIVCGRSDSEISGTKTENSYGSADFWILKLNATGEIIWQKTIGGDIHEVDPKVSIFGQDGYVFTGVSNSGISGVKTEESQGGADYWIIKTDLSGNIIWQNTIGGNGSDWPTSIRVLSDKTILVGGVSKSTISGDKLLNNAGISDFWIICLNENGLLIKQQVIGGDQGERLNSMFIEHDGILIAGNSNSGISGQKTEICRGNSDIWVLKLHTNICETEQSYVSEVACERYVSPSGKIWTISGEYKDTIPGFVGCDSVIIINLTVNKSVYTVTQTGAILNAEAVNATYQWLDCNKNYLALSGETYQYFTATSNGAYAVEITHGECIDTSECFMISDFTYLLNDFGNALHVYPNPTEKDVHIELDQIYSNISVCIKSITGQVKSTHTYDIASRLSIELTGEKGIYLLELVTTDGKRAIIKVLKI